jgi:WD40 repeat protein
VRVWRVGAGAMRAVAALPGPTGDTHHVAFAPDGAHLFAGGDDGAVRAWTVRGGSVGATSMHVIARHTGGVVALAVSTSGRALATTGRDGRVVRIALDREARAERDLASTPIAIAVDDDRAAVIDSDGALWRWLRDDQAPFHAIPIDATALSSLRDGRALVGLRDGEVIQVDLR